MTAASDMRALRSRTVEWHRRGMRSPAEIEAIVLRHLDAELEHEPTYGDFFRAV